MKRLLVILVVLCPCVLHGSLFAQIYTTSSSNYRSYTTSGGLLDPPSVEFHSTSPFGKTLSRGKTYSTAPMQVANGTITTVASTIQGGALTDDLNTGGTGYIPQNDNPVIPGVPDTPLGGGWDVMLFLGILCMLYVSYLRRKSRA